MCELKYKGLRSLMMLLALAVFVSSCTSDSVDTTTNDYCYISSVVLGTVKRKVQTRDRQGNVISTVSSSITGSNFLFTIDQRNLTIENRDSLPYGCDLSAVTTTIAFSGSLLLYRVKGSDDAWLTHSTTDSLDLTRPLELFISSNDALTDRTYTLRVNVHQQEGDSLYWTQCESEVQPLTGMTDMKAFTLRNELKVLGQKGGAIALAERSSVEATGTWTELTTNLPLTSDLQTLCNQDGTLYLSTTDGQILSSTNATDWSLVGTTLPSGLILLEKTPAYFYALSEGKIFRSADAETWEQERLDTDADLLPVTELRTLTVTQPNGNHRIILVGQKDGEASATVWSKMWNEAEAEGEATWTYYPVTHDNQVPCPRLSHLNLHDYDGSIVAFGGASDDGTLRALSAMYISRDYGITWRPSTELHMPYALEGTAGCITSTIDHNQFIWIITDAQVWRGRLNRLGFAQQ